MLGLLAPLDDEPVELPSGEAHPHPGARHGSGGELLGHGVLEDAVEVGERRVDDNGSDRPACAGRWLVAAQSCHRPRGRI